MTKPEEFTPYVLETGYGVVMVEVKACAKCARQTLVLENGWKCTPHWRTTRAEQMKRASWVDRARVTTANGGILCVECAPDAAAFTCALCNQERTGKPQASFGDPGSHLCATCYETVPAKVWAAKETELLEEHRYDFA